MELSQEEADQLVEVEKWFDDPDPLELQRGTKMRYNILSEERGENFKLDAYRGKRGELKLVYNHRVRKVFKLVRVCINGSTHRNPDGEVVPENHIHFYQEGYHDKWAEPLDNFNFENPENTKQALIDFCDICNITNLPNVNNPLL